MRLAFRQIKLNNTCKFVLSKNSIQNMKYKSKFYTTILKIATICTNSENYDKK